MAFYYVKSGGTATGDGGRYATEQTGSFAALGASGYYATIGDALGATTAPVVDDRVLVSDAHAETIGSLTWSFPITGAGTTLLASVSDTNIDQYSKASSAQVLTTSASDDLTVDGKVTILGIYFRQGDHLRLQVNGVLQDCTLGLDNSGSQIYFGGIANTVNILLIDIDIVVIGGTGHSIDFSNNGSRLVFINCDFSAITGNLMGFFANLEGGFLQMIGCDLSGVTGYIVDSPRFGPAYIELNGCKLNASLTGLVNGDWDDMNSRIRLFNSSSSSSAAEYQFIDETNVGILEDATNIYRNESTAFPGGTKVSGKITTTAICSINSPFHGQLPTRFAELSTSSTVRIYLASTSSLTDSDIWVTLTYPDGTTKNVFNRISSRNSDFLSAGSALSADSGSDWRDGASALTGYNEYQIDLDTVVDAGADSVPEIRVYCSKPSTIVYIDTTVDVV